MLGTNIGIDLGTTSVAITVEGKGVVLNEPSIVVYGTDGRIKAVGKKAANMPGRNPEGMRVVKPIEHGVISDFTATRHMLQYFMSKICKNMIFKPNVVACIPSGVTQLEKKTMLDLIKASGAANARTVEEPLAAAFGAGIATDRRQGVMIVDIGGGTTDIAVVANGGITISKSIRTAGNELDESIKRYLKNEKYLVISDQTAEEIKIKIGSALYRDIELGLIIKGKDYITNQPAFAEITSTEVFLAMRQKLLMISEAVKDLLRELTPELSADILESGIYLTGGGALLRSMDKFLNKETGVKVIIPSEPLNCVALGTSYFNDFEK